ncbi:MAG: hypothetical protein WCL39_07270 [Armatimonadota bacterium]
MESIPSTKRGPVAWLQKLDCGASMWLGMGALAVPVVICWRSIDAVKYIPGVGGAFLYGDFHGTEWLLVLGLAAASAGLWFALLGVLIGKLLRTKPVFEKVFLSVCLGSSPWLCMEGVLIRANASAAAQKPAQYLTCGAAALSITLILVLMNRLAKLGWVRGFFSALPIVFLAVGIGVLGHWEEDLLLSGARDWNEVRGKHVSIFYEDTLTVAQAKKFADMGDKWLPQIKRKLGAGDAASRPEIYIMHNNNEYDLYAGDHGHNAGITLAYSILMREEFVKQSPSLIAHELIHIAADEVFGDNQPAMLNEGLADYMQRALSPNASDQTLFRLSFLTIRTLSDDNIFYSYDLQRNVGMDTNAMYANASSLVRFLTDAYGWKPYLEFHRLSSAPSNTHVSAMEKASRKLFHMSLPDLDRAWGKQAWGQKAHR